MYGRAPMSISGHYTHKSEREGFEPPVRLLVIRRISSEVPYNHSDIAPKIKKAQGLFPEPKLNQYNNIIYFDSKGVHSMNSQLIYNQPSLSNYFCKRFVRYSYRLSPF